MNNKNEVVEIVEELNAVQLLLGMDLNDIKNPKKKHRMFCKKLGIKMDFEIEALTPAKATEIQQKSMKYETVKDKTSFEIDMYTSKLRTVTEGCKMFKDVNIQANFGCSTPHQLIETILVNGELTELHEEINKLSAVEEINEDEIKN